MNSVPAVINNSTRAAVAPDAPTGLTATASGTDTINLSWTAPVDNGGRVITGYKIEVSIDSGTTWTDLVADTASTTTTYEHTGLAASTRRDYRVSAINSIGTGTTPSDVVDATTGAPMMTGGTTFISNTGQTSSGSPARFEPQRSPRAPAPTRCPASPISVTNTANSTPVVQIYTDTAERQSGHPGGHHEQSRPRS